MLIDPNDRTIVYVIIFYLGPLLLFFMIVWKSFSMIISYFSIVGWNCKEQMSPRKVTQTRPLCPKAQGQLQLVFTERNKKIGKRHILKVENEFVFLIQFFLYFSLQSWIELWDIFQMKSFVKETRPGQWDTHSNCCLLLQGLPQVELVVLQGTETFLQSLFVFLDWKSFCQSIAFSTPILSSFPVGLSSQHLPGMLKYHHSPFKPRNILKPVFFEVNFLIFLKICGIQSFSKRAMLYPVISN